MLEARLPEAGLLKRVLDSVSGLLTDANFDCSSEGIRLQAMDNSHVALSCVELRSDGFEPYRCDRPITIGVSLASLTKIVKSGNNDDILTLRKSDQTDTLSLTFESAKTDRLAEYDLKLMDIDAEHLGIPDTDYEAIVTMSSGEFSRVCRDLANIGDSVTMDVQKDGIVFSTDGEIGRANLHLKPGGGPNAGGVKVKKGKVEDEDSENEPVKNEFDEEDEEEEEEKKTTKKRKRGDDKKEGSSKAKAAVEEEVPVQIDLTQAVKLTFSVKYLTWFAKAAPLSNQVKLSLARELPLMCEFAFENGHVRYFLAPKLAEDEEEQE